MGRTRECTEFEIESLPNLFNLKNFLKNSIMEQAYNLGLSELLHIRLVKTEAPYTRAFGSLVDLDDNDILIRSLRNTKFYGPSFSITARTWGKVKTTPAKLSTTAATQTDDPKGQNTAT